MRIDRIECTAVLVPMKPGTVHSPIYEDSCDQFDWKGHSFSDYPKYIYRLWSDDGACGIGESYRQVSEATIERNARALVGRNPLELNLQSLPFPRDREYDGFEVAVHDLVGKLLGVPVSFLLGGAVRDRVAVSYWTGRRTPDDMALIAAQALERGFFSLKMKCALDDPHRERLERITEICGADFEVVLDPNQRFEIPANAMRVAGALNGYRVMFEDPLARWNLAGYRYLREHAGVPIALHVHLPYAAHGQHIEEVALAIRQDAVDYLNLGGGLWDFRNTAAMAGIAGIPVWHGTEVDLGILDASYVHACAAAPACTLPSDMVGNFLREDDLIREPLIYEKGSVRVPQGPGLGVELDEQALRRYSIDVREFRP